MKLKVKVAIVLDGDEARRMQALAMAEHKRQKDRLPVEETQDNDDMLREYERLVDRANDIQQQPSKM